MERKKPNDARNLSEDVSENSSEVELAALIEDLGGHKAQLRFAVRKIWGAPGAATGYFGLVPVPPGGLDFLLQMIVRQWGAGWYELRPYGRNAKGRMGYLPGSVTIELGDPTAAILNPATGPGQPVIVQQPPALSQDLLRLLLERNGGGDRQTELLLRALLERPGPSDAMIGLLGQLVRGGGGGGGDLEQAMRLARFIDARRNEQQQQANSGGGMSDEAMERMMLMTMFGRIMGPEPQRAPAPGPRQPVPPRAAPAASPAARRGVDAGEGTARPGPAPRRAAPPPATPNPPEPDELLEDDDDGEELSLEDEIAEHVQELSEQDPDQAVAWLLERLAALPPSVRARFAELQAHGAAEPNVVTMPRARGGGS